MKNTIIEVRNEEENRNVQLFLFNKNIRWVTGKNSVQFTDKKYLVVDKLNSKKPAISYLEKFPSDIKHGCYYKHRIITAKELL